MANSAEAPNRRSAAFVTATFGYLGLGISVAGGIVLMPMYLQFIPERLYGLWLATGGIIGWLGVLDLSVGTIVAVKMGAAFGRKNWCAIGYYYCSGLLIQLLVVGILLGIAAGLCPLVGQLLRASGDEGRILLGCNWLASIAMALAILANGQRSAAEALLKPLFPAIITLIGSIVSILITVLLLRGNIGLYALPLGTLVGGFLTLFANLFYSTALVRRIGGVFRFDRSAFNEILLLSPVLIIGKLGNVLVSRIEPTLITLALRPEDAVIFNITRRGGDIAHMMIDRVLAAIIPSFVHHVAEGDKQRSSRLLSRIISFCFAIGTISVGCYVIANGAFVQLWVGNNYFGGQYMTFLIGIAILPSAFNNLHNCLISATGDLRWPPLAVGLEAIVRLFLMIGLVSYVGVIGLPLGWFVSSMIFAWWSLRRLRKRLPVLERDAHYNIRVLMALLVVAACCFVGVTWRPADWQTFTVTFLLASLAIAFTQIALDPSVREECVRYSKMRISAKLD